MFTVRPLMQAPQQAEASNNLRIFGDYSDFYWDSTRETLVGIYARRSPTTGLPVEDINGIIHRVAYANAMAELKYALKPQELIDISFEQAIKHPLVQQWAKVFADHIGKQRFWANTPGNINADPEISLKVLKYWAHGQLSGLKEEEIWLRTDEFIKVFESSRTKNKTQDHHMFAMGKLASELKGKGCLAACGVAFVEDSLEGIQETAKIEALAAKAAMGMGLNTSSLRPWGSIIGNGAAASGPDRFYEKSIAKAVEAVAQGGRRGGALIELRNSEHPDILLFIEKKRLLPRPSLAKVFRDLRSQLKQKSGESNIDYKKRLLVEAEIKFGQLYSDYIDRQNYLKNTNITLLAMPGFMDAVRDGLFYPAKFQNEVWTGPIYDPRRPVRDEKTGLLKVNTLTKELVYEEYSVDLNIYPEAREAARKLEHAQVELRENELKVRGHFYAPEVFQRIIEGMQSSGEPGIAFFDHVNESNANNHIYDLNTCNPCGEQFLPAGAGKDGRIYMGTCNLSSMHSAHREFWNEDGSYNMERMKEVARVMQRFMDNVSDISWYPLPEQNMTTRMERRNGGGFAGIAEYLSRLGLEFGEEMALSSVQELYRQFTRASVEASQELAKERGVYPLWEGSRFSRKNLAVRNSCMTNNAPTGTLAQALQTSWGVDPHNGIVFSRKVRSRHVNFVAPGFREAMEKNKAWPATEEEQNALMQKIRENHKSCRGLDMIPDTVQRAFPVRVEIEPEKYIKHLAAIHKGAAEFPEAFNSVSNTCSIPLDMSDQAIGDAVLLAYELGVKDVTFYPDGSRLSQPVEQIAAQRYETEADLLSLLGHQEQRPINIEETAGLTYKVRVGSPGGGSTLHVSLNHEVEHPGELVEVYARMGKPGAIEAGLFEAVGRLASAFLQYAAQFGESERALAEQTIVQQLINIQSGYPAFFRFGDNEKPAVIQSPCDGLAKSILEYRKSFSKISRHLRQTSDTTYDADSSNNSNGFMDEDELRLGICSHCGQDDWTKADGCYVCQSCGYSKCG
jgi:ribonucleotide reductase alpha subunit